MTQRGATQNTDREIWRETPGDYSAPSIHVAAEGGVGIDVAGRVFVMDVRDWHRLAMESYDRDMRSLSVMCVCCGKPAVGRCEKTEGFHRVSGENTEGAKPCG